jgi:hypothetical protein
LYPLAIYSKLGEIRCNSAKEVVPEVIRLLISLVLCKWVHPKTSPTGSSHPGSKVKGR